MALSKHPNVLRVYGSFVTGSKLHIVTPYLASGTTQPNPVVSCVCYMLANGALFTKAPALTS